MGACLKAEGMAIWEWLGVPLGECGGGYWAILRYISENITRYTQWGEI